jgi:hypothetical protein
LDFVRCLNYSTCTFASFSERNMMKRKINASHTLMTFSTLILAALALHPIGVAGAISGTPVYVLGVSSPLDPLVADLQGLTSSVTILPTVSGVSSLGTGSILYIDGGWLSTQASLDPTILSVITNTVLQGLPTIVVRGNPAILADSINGLLAFHSPGFPLISEGVKILGTLPNGIKQGATLQVLAGFDYAISAEFQWAEGLLTQTAATIAPAQSALQTSSIPKASSRVTVQTSTSAPFWNLVTSATTDSGDAFKPMGRLTATNTVFLLQNSGTNGAYNWWNFFENSTIQPGIMIYNSPWRTSQEINSVTLGSGMIVAHGPVGQFSSGPATITYSIGTQAGVDGAAVTANQTQSYFIKNTSVGDTNSSSQVSWIHNVDPRSDSGKLTFQISPGFTNRVTECSSCSSSSFAESFTFTAVELKGGTIDDSSSTTLPISGSAS